ncbi:mitochondrial pyruvate carrier 2 [Penicillium citrinum]|uniref:Mitochondrial pyruvate carrier n=2 Tax=Penicillium TaxID=5073 RepID=A0A9W9PCP9_PENCI|nr:mitochondrial pyruvate carrier 2 [Penicillium citrinum]KAJ5242001.1 mitochondrial pyruvate carrier 2 [Penicillium citrinum]KAJ5600510.1 mitochondrial pyruvate carrier 2 [Penicillium hetheringtonii]
MSSRVGFRFFNNARFAFRNASAPFRRPGGQGWRFQSSDAGAAAAEQQSTFQRMWNSPVGVKTVHFWAPVMKWALVIAGISDFNRPAEKLSLTQNAALMGTGAIWTRWCLIIKPRNVLLAAVNFFLGCVGVVQVSRIYMWRRSQEGSAVEAAKDLEQDVADSAKSVAKQAEGAVEGAVKSVEKSN